jgi:hypothetical protein
VRILFLAHFPLSSSLLRFAHKTLKNRLSADFLPYKPRSYQRYAQPDNQGFFAALSAKNPQVQQAAGIPILMKPRDFPAKEPVPDTERARD